MQIYKAATASHKLESEDFPPPVHGSTFYNLLLTTTMNPSFAFFSLNFSSPVSEDPADLVTRAAIFISFNISFKSPDQLNCEPFALRSSSWAGNTARDSLLVWHTVTNKNCTCRLQAVDGIGKQLWIFEKRKVEDALDAFMAHLFRSMMWLGYW